MAGRKKLYTQRVILELTPEMLTEIEKEAIQKQISRNQAIRNIIAKGLKNE